MKFCNTKNQNGITLIEVLVVSAIVAVFFVAVFEALQYAQRLTAHSEARLSAMTLATERIEYFRSLSYHDVGTVGGPVFGGIPNNNILTLNDITFYEDVRVEFVLDPGDDVLGIDSNGILNDYKKVELEIEWFAHGVTSSVSYTSNIVPLTVESDEGYGAVKVEVRDEATGLPLSGADVRITNDVLVPPIDFTRTTGPEGVVLAAVPAGSGYHASTTMTDYSIDKTYEITVPNPNPSPNSFLVEEALIADRPFRSGELSDITITSYSDITDIAVTEDFDDLSGVSVGTDVQINATDETLELAGSPGSYVASGNARLLRIVPATLDRWENAVVIGSAAVGTQFSVQFYTGDCAVSCSLVSDSDLPGNSTGVISRFVDLTNLDVGAYPDLTVQVNLQGDTTETSSVDDVAVYYRSSDTFEVGSDLVFHGDKVIGTSPDIYKYEMNETTDGSGEVSLTDVEFDSYTIDTGTLTPTRVCGDVTIDEAVSDIYFAHDAGVDTVFEVVLESTLTDTLRAIVTTDVGVPIPGAEVLLERTSFSELVVTDTCGQAFINNTDGVQIDYDVTVSRPGYADEVLNNVTIDADTRLRIILNES